MSAQKRRGLGRGLGALIPTGPADDAPEVASATAVALEERPAPQVDPEPVPTSSTAVSETSEPTPETPVPAIGAPANGPVDATPAAVEPAESPVDDSAPATIGSPADEPADEPGSSAVSSPATEPAAGSTSVPDGPPSGTAGAAPADTPNGTATTETAEPGKRLPSAFRPTARPKWDEAMESGRLAGSNGASGEAASALDTAFFGGGDVSRETQDLLPVPGARFAELPVGAIHPNARQPRTVFDEGDLDELVESIKEIGVLQPIVVRPDKAEPGTYELIMGERRWRATQAAGHEAIPAIIRDTEDSDMLRDALLENLHRAALNPLEEAAAYRQLLDDFGCTHEELATRIARSRPQISNTLRLLRLPPLVQRRVAAGVLSAGHARALLGLSDAAEIERLAQRIVSEGLSVRATEEIVMLTETGGAGAKPRKAPRPGTRLEAVDELATRLSDRFETRVKVSVGKTKGRLTVEFASVDDLNRILAVMAPEEQGLFRPAGQDDATDDATAGTD